MSGIGRYKRPVVALVAVCSLAGLAGGVQTLAAPAGDPAHCPRAVPSVPPRNPWKAAERQLAAAPVAQIRLCRYSEHLIRASLVPAVSVGSLLRAFNALRLTPATHLRLFTSCFFDLDPIVAHLVYAGGHSVAIYVPTSSCVSADNGDITRAYPVSARIRLRGRPWCGDRDAGRAADRAADPSRSSPCAERWHVRVARSVVRLQHPTRARPVLAARRPPSRHAGDHRWVQPA
jgi:hypothetical protein